MSVSDQENYERSTKRRKKSANPAKPFALSQQVAMDTSLNKSLNNSAKSAKRHSSVSVDAVVAKKARSQSSSFPVYPDEECSQFEKSSAGVVMSVNLVNFMCHSHFEIKLNPRINFISGQNGSGKSAIQTAMVIGLGGTASKTNRSSKVDGLIKHGCQSGSIAITLSNYGWNAYKPSEFGTSIRIVRNINQSSSNYKVYNQWGKLMGTTKKEVENICTRLRIQPNNPVAILNQDMARNFLSSNKAEDKYSLFRKAILLDEAEVVLRQLSELMSEHENQLESKRRAIIQITDEVQKMSKKMKLVEDLRMSKAQKFELENELAWSKVNHFRDEKDHLTSRRDQQVEVKKTLLGELEGLQTEITGLRDMKKKFEGELANMRAEWQSREEIRQQLAANFRIQKKLYENKCMDCEVLESNLKSRRRDHTTLQKGLDDIQRMDLEQKQRKEGAERQKSVLETDREMYESKELVLRGEISRVQKNIELCQEKMSKLAGSMDEMRHTIASCQRQIQALGNKSDTLSMYEPWMAALVRKIDEAVKNKKFSKPPLGPLGRYIKVKDEKWVYAIESNLSIGLLSSFLVNNVNDRRVLYSIMDEVLRSGRKPTVHCSKFQDQKRDRELPNLETSHRNYSNMLRTMSVDNVIVTNFLMDYRMVHRILLVEQKEDCRRFIEHDSNIPRNCIMILDKEAAQYLDGYRVYENYDRNRRARILRKSAADQRRLLEEEVSEKHELIIRKNEEYQAAQRECEKHTSVKKQMNRDLQTVKTLITRTKAEIREQNDLLEMEVPSLQMKLDEMKEIETEIQQFEEQRQALIAERTEAQENMMKSKEQMNSDSQGDSFSQQTQLNNDKDRAERQLSALNSKLSNVKKGIDEQDKKLSTLDKRIEEVDTKLDAEEYNASQLTESELKTTRATTEIQRELRNVETFIDEAQRKLGQEESQFHDAFLQKQDSLRKQVEYFSDLQQLQKDSKEMYTDRERRIGEVRDTNAIVIMTKFQSVLKRRNYRGNLKFEHKAGKLDIMMAPIDGGNTLMNTSSLSGGEKSYSTVAFLLALWSNMNLPFYSMDEYDVFMDAINRKTITKLLMQFATTQENKQFIFLTPLDVSIVQISDHVQVHKVKKIQN